jgi:hypothetical protein
MKKMKHEPASPMTSNVILRSQERTSTVESLSSAAMTLVFQMSRS